MIVIELPASGGSKVVPDGGILGALRSYVGKAVMFLPGTAEAFCATAVVADGVRVGVFEEAEIAVADAVAERVVV